MAIDWFTMSAQVANFLILVWLLKRFLYKPILQAIDEREKRIAGKLADADKIKAEARNQSDEFRDKNRTFDEERAALMSKATQEASDERRRLLEEARTAAAALSAKKHDTLISEEHALHKAISSRTRQEVFAIARKTLSDLAGTSLEERMVDRFVSRLHEITNEEKAAFVAALASAPMMVRTAFDLPQPQRDATEHALREVFGAETQVRFETAPDVVSGIELSTNGHKVAWSIAEYLVSLENGIGELLRVKSRPEETHAD